MKASLKYLFLFLLSFSLMVIAFGLVQKRQPMSKAMGRLALGNTEVYLFIYLQTAAIL